MKTQKSRNESGNTLVVVLLVVFVVAVAMTSYLTMVSNQNNTVARSETWNQCIPVCESGIEEALTQIHYWNNVFVATNNWTLGADGNYHKTRTNSDGSYYAVGIIPTNPPIIYSTGFVQVPFNWNKTNNNWLSRRVRVNTLRQPQNGINAKGTIALTGGASIDSYNSSDPAYNTGGKYDVTKREQNAQVLTDLGTPGAIAVGTGTIYGTAITGPGGTVTGDAPKGGTANNANVQFIPDPIPAPFAYATGITPTNGSYLYNGTNYTYLLGSGNYSMAGGINLGGGKSMVITGNPTVLYVNGDFTCSGSGFIYIVPGAVLQMYIDGTGTFSGGNIVNGSGYATNCYLYGMTNCGTMTFSGSAAFTGVVSAPEAAFTYSGSADFSGAVSAGSVLLSGSGNFHYDNSLNSINQVVASWNEF